MCRRLDFIFSCLVLSAKDLADIRKSLISSGKVTPLHEHVGALQVIRYLW